MNVPEQLKVRVIAPDETDLSGFIVELTVSTGRRNPYHIRFPKTDHHGVATLSRDDFVGQFTDHWEAGLMDHYGNVDDASSIVTVALYEPSRAIANPKGSLSWPLMRHERTKWSSREEEYRYRVSTRNVDFVARPLTVDLQTTSEITLQVRRKDDSTNQ